MLLKSLSRPASPAFMIGDKRDDMLAASKNGIPAIGVTWGYGTAQELNSSGALALAASPGDLEGPEEASRRVQAVSFAVTQATSAGFFATCQHSVHTPGRPAEQPIMQSSVHTRRTALPLKRWQASRFWRLSATGKPFIIGNDACDVGK
ncbi:MULTISPECIES: HAD hydrolase-like protein [unclassified Pseudomonas]|uniref:HAD hydrolase-like protein n=1 Tax=unclassified Pseudomonas TaxID=196821 RepID=UPI0025D15067|nr:MULTISPECIES: HAD hydrolase-like protein [unclassified Pseudomonas]